MPKQITIEIPEEISLLIEEDVLLRSVVDNIVVQNLKDFLMKFLTYDKILSDKGLTEGKVMEIDEEVKEIIWKKVKEEWML